MSRWKAPYTLRMHGIVIGRSELEDADRESGIVRGEFRPALGYELVQPVFDLHDQATAPSGEVVDPAKLDRFEKARAALGLELIDASNRHVPAHSVLLGMPAGRRTPQLEVRIDDPAYWTSRSDAPPR